MAQCHQGIGLAVGIAHFLAKDDIFLQTAGRFG
jgi:hypothetical protein